MKWGTRWGLFWGWIEELTTQTVWVHYNRGFYQPCQKSCMWWNKCVVPRSKSARHRNQPRNKRLFQCTIYTPRKQ